VEKTSSFENDVTHVLCAKVTDARAETVDPKRFVAIFALRQKCLLFFLMA
jgi:hypothetical protein